MYGILSSSVLSNVPLQYSPRHSCCVPRSRFRWLEYSRRIWCFREWSRLVWLTSHRLSGKCLFCVGKWLPGLLHRMPLLPRLLPSVEFLWLCKGSRVLLLSGWSSSRYIFLACFLIRQGWFPTWKNLSWKPLWQYPVRCWWYARNVPFQPCRPAWRHPCWCQWWMLPLGFVFGRSWRLPCNSFPG